MDFAIKPFNKGKHSRRNSAAGGGSSHSSHEELPMLSFSNYDNEPDDDQDTRRHPDKEVIVKMDRHRHHHRSHSRAGGGNDDNKEDDDDDDDSDARNHKRRNDRIYKKEDDGVSSSINSMREPSYKFWSDSGKDKPMAAGSSNEIALDMDLEMDELKKENDQHNPNGGGSKLSSPSREIRVSFEPTLESAKVESFRRHYKNIPEGEDEVVRCSANASFDRKSSFLRRSNILSIPKTKSRILDPPEPPPEEVAAERKSGRIGKSGPIPPSGLLMDDDEEDPFSVDDLPDKFRRAKLNAIVLIEWLSLFVIISALVCSLSIPFLREKTLWSLRFWKWEIFVLVLICGRLVSGWGIKLIVFFIERNFFMRKRVLYFVYGLRKAVQNCLWLGLVLVAWHILLYKKVERETRSGALLYVTRVLICFLLGTLLWLIKTLIIKVLASSFHVSTYFDRIQVSLFNQYIIETLSGPPLIEIQRNEEEEERMTTEIRKLQNAGVNLPADLRAAGFESEIGRSGRQTGNGGSTHRSFRTSRSFKGIDKSGPISKQLAAADNGITIDHLHKLNNKNVSAWNMKRLINIVRHCSLSTLDEQMDNSYEDDSANQIRSEYEAKAAAKKIFHNVARRGYKYIYLDDLKRFLPEDEAMRAMSLFEGATENRRITKSSLKNWVVNSFRERRALSLTLNDTKTAVKKLHNVVNILVSILILVIWLVILNIATSRFLLFVSSQLVLVAFIFGNTCKTVFESIIFLFVIHPFDVGDRCEIEGVQMVVEEMNIMTTVFLRYDNLKIIFPNSTLSQKFIGNFYRSPDMGDAIEFLIHIATPAEKIAILRQKIISHIENKKEHWYTPPMVIFRDMDQLQRVKIAVWLQHKMNHQDMGEKFVRRSQLLEEMVKLFKELDLQYRLLPIDINVCAMPTPSNTPTTSNSQLPPLWTPLPIV